MKVIVCHLNIIFCYYFSHFYFVCAGDPTFPEVAVTPPDTYVYQPNYCQYFYPSLGFNRERNVGTVAEVEFTKLHDHTVLWITWEGNFRKKSCTNCCAKWWVTINGGECTGYENILTSISSNSAADVFSPTTVTGVCHEASSLPIAAGRHVIKLEVGNCDLYRITNTASGFYSSSRFIVEEVPRRECMCVCVFELLFHFGGYPSSNFNSLSLFTLSLSLSLFPPPPSLPSPISTRPGAKPGVIPPTVEPLCLPRRA